MLPRQAFDNRSDEVCILVREIMNEMDKNKTFSPFQTVKTLENVSGHMFRWGQQQDAH